MARASAQLPLALLLLVLPACGPRPVSVHTIEGNTMGTTYTVKYVDETPLVQVLPQVDARLDLINAVFSTYIEDSEISRFNAHDAVDAAFPVSDEFAAVVRLALEIATKTEGAFDPTVLPVVDAAGFGPAGRQVDADAQQREEARGKVGYDRLVMDGSRGLRKLRADVSLDLSAIAKGHGVDAVCRLLDEQGIGEYMVEIGGEVRCRGHKPDGNDWVIGIERPPAPGEPLDVVERVTMRDRALATSGSYRIFRAGGEHHIVDPRTGTNPTTEVISVSVLASTCALADGLATGLFVAGPDRAETVLARFDDPNLAALFVMRADDGKLTTVGVRWQ